MNWKESYNDICSELRILQLHEIEVRRRVQIAHKVLFTGEMPSSVYCHVPLDMGIEKYNSAVTELEAIQAEVDRMQKVKDEIESEMMKFTGLANVIQCKRIVEGKTYKELEKELGYSESYMRLIVHRSKNDNKVITQSTKAS
ncbi:hypothetical protein D3C75_575200 [compost metagenome]